MRPTTLYDWLVARAFLPRIADRNQQETVPDTPLSRRAFLASSGSVSIAALAALEDQSAPRFARSGRVVLMFFEGLVWRIDPGAFGSAASVKWTSTGEGRFLVTLTDAVLPGTDLDVSFRAEVVGRRGEWSIRLALPAQRFNASAPLGAWLRETTPLSGLASTKKIAYGGGSFTLGPGVVTLAVRPRFGFRLTAKKAEDRAVTLVGPVSAVGEALVLDIDSPSQESLRWLMRKSRARATRFTFAGPSSSGTAVTVGRTGSGEIIGCCVEDASALSGELYASGNGDEGLVLVEGAMRLFTGDTAPDAAQPSQIWLERGALSAIVSGADCLDTAIAGRVRRAWHVVEASGYQFTICGDDDHPMFVQSRGGRTEDLHVRARLGHVWAPVPGAVGATITLPGRAVDVVLSASRRPSAAHVPRGGLISLGRHPFAVVPLEGARLNLRRGVDLLNLTFGFEGFDLRVLDGQAWLIRHRPEREKDRWPAASLSVFFPPQHVAEAIANVVAPTGCEPGGALPTESGARLSAPSRLIFALSTDPQKRQWAEQPLTIEGLTDWIDLSLQVHARALEPDASIDTQLQLAGLDTIDQSASIEILRDRLKDTLRRQMRAPSVRETALTMSGRLILSPSSSARWSASAASPSPLAAPLWHARMTLRGRKSVRAIWSTYLQESSFAVADEPGPASESEPRLPLSPSNHWNIVGQTSVYGLPALRRIGPTDQPPNGDRAYQPRSRVVRWPRYEQMLGTLDGEPGISPGDIGFALPQPFDDADLILTSLGGSFVADWRGEPPNLRIEATGSLGFSLERLQYRSQLGRDIRVEVVNKGYVLPLGVRCSHVELTERRFFKNPTHAHPTAYLVKRRFLLFGNPEKEFPGVHHPFGSRDFPAARIRMLTRKTPDLISTDPVGPQPTGTAALLEKSGRVRLPAPHPDRYLVFWPRTIQKTTGASTDVDFSWAVDDEPTPAVSNLLFVENSVMADEGSLRIVVEHYRALTKEDLRLRTARHAGARRRYAPPAEEGDTAFDTDSWVLSVRGRLVSEENPQGELFRMDARMEGADQPPFYPVVEEASINVQSLDRLLGAPQGLVCVGYTPEYVRSGFKTSANPSEIYLSVLGPDIALDVTNQGGKAGGIAKPNALVVALSRQVGVVGGRRMAGATLACLSAAARSRPGDASSPSDRMTLDQNALAVSTSPRVGVDSPYDFSKALAGQFDPAEFLGGLGNAKLLGLIPLERVLKTASMLAAPKLLEQIVEGPLRSAAEGGREALVEAFAGGALKRRIDDLKRELDRLAVGQLTAKDLYPDLYNRFDGLSRELGKVTPAIESAPLEQLPSLLSPVVREGKALVREIERTIADPLPSVVQAVLTGFANGWRDLERFLRTSYADLPQLIEIMVRAKLQTFCEDVRAVAPDLFGLIPEDVISPSPRRPAPSCAEIFDAPWESLRRAEEALFAEQFARPMFRLLTWARGTTGELLGRLDWAGSDFEAAARAAIADAALKYGTRLQRSVSEADLDRIAQDIVGRLRTVIDEIIASEKDVFERLDKIERGIESARYAVDAIRASAAAFPAKVAIDADRLVSDLARDVEKRTIDAARSIVGGEIERIRPLIRSALEEARAQGAERMLQGVRHLLHAMVSAFSFAEIVRAAETSKAWCEEIGGAPSVFFAAVEALASRLVPSDETLRATLEQLSTAIAQIERPVLTPSRAHLLSGIERARAAVLEAIQQVGTTLMLLKKHRAALAELAKERNLCRTPAKVADVIAALRRIVNDRADAIARTQDAVERIVAFEKLWVAAAGSFRVPQSVSHQAVNLLRAVTGIDEITRGADGVWHEAKAQIAVLTDELRLTYGAIARQIDEQVAVVEQEANRLWTRLDEAEHAARTDVLATVVREVRRFAVDVERGLISSLAQTVAFPLAQATALFDLIAGASGILREVAGKAADVHTVALTHVSTVVETLEKDDLVRILIHPDVRAKLSSARMLIERDRNELTKIQGGDLAAARALVEEWRDRPPALVDLVRTLADLADALLRGDIGAIANFNILRDVARALRDQLQAALRELVPTTVRLTYQWQTKVGAFPEEGDDAIFAMQESSPDDLQLTAEIAVNPVAQTRSALVRGRLRPFRIKLFGPYKIATISFSEASFESRNGSAPAFHARVAGVKTGELIKFLEPLQKWLSPEGGGFYVRPILDPPAIEAGYSFASDIIPLGPVQFVNVALDVSARLPFTDKAALFRFSFASPERPFMIVAPPYGGGGYVSLVASAGRVVEFRMSLVFGAVVAIKFGPLRAHGRVVAGVFIETREEERTIGALVEAVGEGNIACFSICVSLRVRLVQVTSSNGSTRLEGMAEFSFEFKMGFVKFRFSFVARYTARNDKGTALGAGGGAGGDAPRPLSSTADPRGGKSEICPPVRRDATYRVTTPRKYRNWRDYQKYFATDLL